MIFANGAKETPERSALTGIKSLILTPRWSASKGGVLHRTLLRIARAEGGQAMPEYALILSLVAAGLVLVFSSLGVTTARLFSEVLTAFTS